MKLEFYEGAVTHFLKAGDLQADIVVDTENPIEIAPFVSHPDVAAACVTLKENTRVERTVTIGASVKPPSSCATYPQTKELDFFTLPAGDHRVTLTFHLDRHTEQSGVESKDPSSFIGFAIREVVTSAFRKPSRSIALTIPVRSQMQEAPDIGPRACSPTSVFMVLESYQKGQNFSQVLKNAHNAESNLYGVWPQNIWTAAQAGFKGYLKFFTSFDDVIALLEKKTPVIASIRCNEGQLKNAAIPQTKGHLVVITGFEGSDVLVNDPAGLRSELVPRRYDAAEFHKAWIGNKGLGYVILPQ